MRSSTSSYLPQPNEQIWEIQLRKWKRDPASFDLSMPVAQSDGFSGAEIEKIVKSALARAYQDGRREPDSDDLCDLCEEFVPLSVTMKEDIARRRERLNGWLSPPEATSSLPPRKGSALVPTTDATPRTR